MLTDHRFISCAWQYSSWPLPASFPTPLTEYSRILPLKLLLYHLLLYFQCIKFLLLEWGKWRPSVQNFTSSPTPMHVSLSVTSSPPTSHWKQCPFLARGLYLHRSYRFQSLSLYQGSLFINYLLFLLISLILPSLLKLPIWFKRHAEIFVSLKVKTLCHLASFSSC